MDAMYVRLMAIGIVAALPALARFVCLYLRYRRATLKQLLPHVVVAIVFGAMMFLLERFSFMYVGLTNLIFARNLGLLATSVLIVHLMVMAIPRSDGNTHPMITLTILSIAFSTLLAGIAIPFVVLQDLDLASFRRQANELQDSSVLIVVENAVPALIEGSRRYQVYPRHCSLNQPDAKRLVFEFTPQSDTEQRVLEDCLSNLTADNPRFFMIAARLTEPPEVFDSYVLYRVSDAQRRFVE